MADTECISYDVGTGMEDLSTGTMNRSGKRTRDHESHMYESLPELQFRTRLAETFDLEQGKCDKQDVVPLKEKLCIAVLIMTVTCLIVSNIVLVLFFIDGKSMCRDAGRFFFVMLKIIAETDRIKIKS